VLAAELETGKPAAAERFPQVLFFRSLFSAQTAGEFVVVA
jgi:hypothetical protein